MNPDLVIELAMKRITLQCFITKRLTCVQDNNTCIKPHNGKEGKPLNDRLQSFMTQRLTYFSKTTIHILIIAINRMQATERWSPTPPKDSKRRE